MKIAFIVPRYEPQMAGGAEVHCQRLAEKLTKHYKVDILTTCARDHFSWKNYYEPGNKVINGITVRRFLADPNRVTPRFLRIQKKIDNRLSLSKREEEWWIEDSIRSSFMERFIEKNSSKYDWYIFMPYLFGTTYWGIKAAGEKALLIPCLHDEPFAYLDVFKQMFNSVAGIMFNTYPEIELAKGIYAIPNKKTTMVSLGFEKEREYVPDDFRKKYGIDCPFMLFAGRREGGKNIDLLLNYFRIYKKNNKSKLKLVLLGSGTVDLSGEDKDCIIDLGYISEQQKSNAFAAASVFCQPSVNESLSIVIMESWLADRPVIVHDRCNVTKDHIKRSNGGLYFGSYPEFEGCVNYLLENQEIANKMGQNGKQYVKEEFSWDKVIDRFNKSLEKFGNNNSS